VCVVVTKKAPAVHLAVGLGPEVTGEVLRPGGGGSQGDAGASGLIFPDDDVRSALSASCSGWPVGRPPFSDLRRAIEREKGVEVLKLNC
jgi:hypothetical protein